VIVFVLGCDGVEFVPAVTTSIWLSESVIGFAAASTANAAVEITDPTITAMICFFTFFPL
jgi:hypothetical protein